MDKEVEDLAVLIKDDLTEEHGALHPQLTEIALEGLLEVQLDFITVYFMSSSNTPRVAIQQANYNWQYI